MRPVQTSTPCPIFRNSRKVAPRIAGIERRKENFAESSRFGTEEGYNLKSQITNTKFQINFKYQFRMIKTILFGILDFGY